MRRKKLLSQADKREIEIEQKDERHILLGNAAKARAYELMMWLYTIAITLLALVGVIRVSGFFILLGIFIVCQVYFMVRLRQYHKKM